MNLDVNGQGPFSQNLRIFTAFLQCLRPPSGVVNCGDCVFFVFFPLEFGPGSTLPRAAPTGSPDSSAALEGPCFLSSSAIS
jgi:hypothetical protein